MVSIMKKITIFALVALLAVPSVMMARETPEEKSKKDYSSWLPAQGDGSIGFGLNPITTFLGNLFNGSTNNTLAALAGDPMGTAGIPAAAMPTPFVSLMGSYMMTNHWELKLNVGFGFVYLNNNYYVQDDREVALNPVSDAKVTDNSRTNNYSGSIAIGAHYRVGETRCVQGIFGGGLLYAFGYANSSYKYGNQFSELNPMPTIASGMGAAYYSGIVPFYPNLRPLSITAAQMHRVGAYGTIGIEAFVAPKIAIGANINLYLFYDFTPAVDTRYEGLNSISNEVGTYDLKVSPANHGVTFSTNNIGANIYLAFYLK